MDISAALAVVRRRWLAVLACLLAGIAGAALVTVTSPKSYRATARLFVNLPSATTTQEALQGVQLSSQLLQSYAKIATSRSVAEQVATKLDGRFTPNEVRRALVAAPQAGTLLIDVTAVDVEPTGARDIANAAAATLVEVVAGLDTASDAQVSARIIDLATTPTTPFAPKPRTNVVLGLLLGLGAAAVVAVALESLDRSISSGAQATAAFGGAPVLTTIPRHRGLDKEPLIALEGSTSAGGESYRALRTCLRYLEADRSLRTVLVTSATSDEGKSTTVANLAVAIAQSGERVIVVDADLRRSKLSSLFGLEAAPGLTEALLGQARLEDVLRPWRGGLSVLPPGAAPPNPSELLGSQAMADLLRALGDLADVVVIDAPPVLPVTDAAVLSGLVDGVVLVARWAKTEVADAEEARYILDGVGAHVLGVVVNQVRSGRNRTYYRAYEASRAMPAPARVSAGR